MTVIIDGTTGISTPGEAVSGNISYTGTLTGGTGVVDLGSGQVYKDASGNVGIGTILPLAPLNINGTGGELLRISVTPNSGVIQEPALGFATGVTNTHPAAKISALEFDASDSRASLLFYTRGDNSDSAPTERARSDSSGNLLVGTTSLPASGPAAAASLVAGQYITSSKNTLVCKTTSASGFEALALVRNGNNGTVATFWQSDSGSAVGNISVTGSATAYNTSSDYRLKEAIAPMTGALAKVALLKPCTYKWKADGSDGQGFIAHELAEVEPGCVTGEKDAVDVEGNPQYQGIDTSFLVATLTAAIQELKSLVDTQAARITALEQA